MTAVLGPPVDASVLARQGRGFEELLTDGAAVYWVDHRPTGGRSVLVSDRDGDVVAPPWSVGSRVHEYGGAAALVHDGTAFFVAQSDQRIHRLPVAGGSPEPLTPIDARRYGDLEPDPRRERLVAVCEDHTAAGFPENYLATVAMAGGSPVVLQSGHDFYQAPRLSPDGARLAFVAWDIPRMPWDGTGLYVCELDGSGACGPVERIAGGDRESVCHPRWSPDGVLHFVSDRDGWWNLYAWNGRGVTAVAPMAAEVGAPGAMGGAPYDVSETHVVAAVRSEGRARLVLIDRVSRVVDELVSDAWEVAQPRFAGRSIVYLGGSPTRSIGVWRAAWPRAVEGPSLLRAGADVDLGADVLAEPAVLRIPTSDGAITHALHYAPHPATRQDRPPPLVVIAHGGPVKATTAALALGDMALMAAAFWTSRGYAVLDVNYRGSTGYGRRYREALHGRWGEIDVDDCVDAARYLVERGEADPARAVLRGWSAGGYTTLMGLACRDFFAAGTAYFPVADLEAVHESTHKYEAGYDHLLIGDWHRDRELYRQRSPVTHAAGITAPVLMIQGLDDPICPEAQTRSMVDELRRLGRDVGYVTFEGEGHGFAHAENIITSLETEAAFYRRVLGVSPRAETV